MISKTISRLAVALVGCAALMSCTHNNGDIGIWFGTWHVEEITIDGTVSEAYNAAPYWFFQFQSNVVQVKMSLPDHSFLASVGEWEEKDANLILTFPDEVYVKQLPPGIDAKRPTAMNIEHKSSKEVVLTFTGTDGHAYRYTLRHWT